MRARSQALLLPAALAIGFVLAILLQRSPTPPHLELVNAKGQRSGPAAFLAPPGGKDFDLTQLQSCFLFEEGETPLVWLGSYKLAGVKTYGGGSYTVVVLELEPGAGEAYLVQGLKGSSEVYALVPNASSIEVVPLLRVVDKGKLIEVYGWARGASHVDVYAFAAPEDYNSSLPPPPNLFVTGCAVVDGKYRVRLERGGAPLTQRGEPLIEVNSTLVLYTGCSHRILDTSNLTEIKDCTTEAEGSVRCEVDLSCGG